MLPDGVVEIKCPWVLRDSKPDDFSKLSKAQIASFCCEQTANGLVLKKSHKYYGQIQLQMWVTGMKYGIFCIQTTSGITVEKIPFDEAYFKNKLDKVVQNYYSIFLPDYFEHRFIRRLPVFPM